MTPTNTPPTVNDALLIKYVHDYFDKGTLRRGVSTRKFKKSKTLSLLAGESHSRTTHIKAASLIHRGGTPVPGQFWSRVSEIREEPPSYATHYELKAYSWGDVYSVASASRPMDLSYLFITEEAFKSLSPLDLKDPSNQEAALAILKETKNRLSECYHIGNTGNIMASLMKGKQKVAIWSTADKTLLRVIEVEKVPFLENGHSLATTLSNLTKEEG
jgi:hypothetical protein